MVIQLSDSKKSTYSSMLCASGMFERELLSTFLSRTTENLALMAGSSKQGKALRAAVAAKNVVAKYLKCEESPSGYLQWFVIVNWHV